MGNISVQKILSNPNPDIRSVSILGSTGSIGKSTVDLLTAYKNQFHVDTLTAHKNVNLLAKQARELNAKHAVIADERLYDDLKDALSGTKITVAAGDEAVIEAAGRPVDWVMGAIVGAAGIKPSFKAIEQGNILALANKESLVATGDFMIKAVEESGATLLPVDSEHNAIFQVFDENQRQSIDRIILTASGGPFLRKSRAELKGITPEQAVKHPNWSMGAKISIDSATMVNKSLEIIEASYLFNLSHKEIDAVIHPQSIIHSMVEYSDGSILAQMGAPDMRTPIAYALSWPNRIKTTGNKLNLNGLINFSFEPVDLERFPSVSLARHAMASGIGYPAAFNAANEAAVDAFLNKRMSFLNIDVVIDKVLQNIKISAVNGIEDIFEIDRNARMIAQEIISSFGD